MNIGIADPQARIRHGLRLLLEQQPGWAVAGEATDTQEVLTLLQDRPIDLLLIDWDLPGLPAEEMLRTLREKFSGLMILSISGRQEHRQTALANGADAFASKVESPTKLLQKIQKISRSNSCNQNSATSATI